MKSTNGSGVRLWGDFAPQCTPTEPICGQFFVEKKVYWALPADLLQCCTDFGVKTPQGQKVEKMPGTRCSAALEGCSAALQVRCRGAALRCRCAVGVQRNAAGMGAAGARKYSQKLVRSLGV